ncbi:hypothetical protein [Agriterribacter sp.]|uniref:hypothetical protein n=1 Tax=Agriterribacter sp. TaxID=2821509 RepID=UPI002D0FEF8C|nr:hypothetical protein [Agriterribacter sp.]HRP55324.1 hypothetical protein [Agriterribacter sp.]
MNFYRSIPIYQCAGFIRIKKHGFYAGFFFFFLFSFTVKGQQAYELERFTIEKITHLQGVAVDGRFFYAFNDNAITKHLKTDGSMVGTWDGSTDSRIKHLNSAIVIKNKLYCAHSNFPESPMASSIEIFDTRTMKHIGSHSFGIFAGSATWIDEKDGFWWVAFAHYSGKHAREGRDNRWTSLVKFNKDWSSIESWIFPNNVLEAFAPNSNSGGIWNRDGLLYITGHDRKEVYVLKVPDMGYTLEYIKTIPVINEGQGIAVDQSKRDREILYGITRKGNQVVVQEIK